jgi:uncharacterized damage-inducible protein DinB
MLTHEQVWYRHHAEVNSIGNLILHLCGNVTQWIGSGLGDRSDNRVRDLEFSSGPLYSKEELMDQLRQLRVITDIATDRLDDQKILDQKSVQGFQETNLSIIVHVIEHFSYHVGQIAYITKLLTNQQVGFYEGMDLSVIN